MRQPPRQSFIRTAAAPLAALSLLLAMPLTPLRAQGNDDSYEPAPDGIEPPALVGRVAILAGRVSFHGPQDTEWVPATLNWPVTSGSSFWAEPGSRAEIEIAGTRLVVEGGTQLDVLRLDEGGLLANLAQGGACVRYGGPFAGPGHTVTIQTPRGSVTLNGPGYYAVNGGAADRPASVNVASGNAVVMEAGTSRQLATGQLAVLDGSPGGQTTQAPRDNCVASLLADENTRRAGPLPPPAVQQMTGWEDLNRYGAWSNAPEYGSVWYPNVAADWVPYRDGHWAYIAPWGWTWVDDAPWGFTPFHYGRWARVGPRWAWIPVGPHAQVGVFPAYAPALVNFYNYDGFSTGLAIGLTAGSIGWVPLGFGEPYYPSFRANDRWWRRVNEPYYGRNIPPRRDLGFEHFSNRGAATFVPTGAFSGSRPIRQSAQPFDANRVSGGRPTAFRAPLQPTQATAGISPFAARQMNLAPAPAGAPQRQSAPGPAFQPRPFQQVQQPGGPQPGSQQPQNIGRPQFQGQQQAPFQQQQQQAPQQIPGQRPFQPQQQIAPGAQPVPQQRPFEPPVSQQAPQQRPFQQQQQPIAPVPQPVPQQRPFEPPVSQQAPQQRPFQQQQQIAPGAQPVPQQRPFEPPVSQQAPQQRPFQQQQQIAPVPQQRPFEQPRPASPPPQLQAPQVQAPQPFQPPPQMQRPSPPPAASPPPQQQQQQQPFRRRDERG